MFEQFHRAIAPFLTFFGDNPYTQAGLVIVLSFVVASLFKYVLIVGLQAVIARIHITLDSSFLTLLHTPIYYSLLLMGFSSAALIIAPADLYAHIIFSSLQSVAILIWSAFFLRANHALLSKIAGNPNRFHAVNNKTLPLFLNLVNIIILVLAVYFVFSVWGVDMTAWLASAGIVGIAVGFAAKDTLANLFSGVFIMADAPYKIGDYIVLDSGERGEVTHIGMRSTRMLTREDVEVTIPNSVMGNSKIINESGGPHEKSRCRIPIGVAYNADIDEVREVLMQIAHAEKEYVCDDPEPRVRFRRYGASALEFELLVWITKPALKGRVIDILNSQIFKQFNQHKIEIPYSKHDLYIKEMPSREPKVINDENNRPI
ncbi:mechanosensitive ion channel family protein [Paraglaciecola sp. L1A13]|uniref:mechanosensitive ion channel family protein n=1 Tax=Paraglaciecola sp. L1A13 TaxID=2686359 RepID=UPI00131D469C|nr:mechanosensitive ion channel family protein [Paraglaciecola sp. L1A13]|tara:strand:+ start:4505 stop:5623 length:1119 start_codon:yes stop_codon:yes gene_type:complete